MSDVIVSGMEYEVLVSDELGSELSIVILDLRGSGGSGTRASCAGRRPLNTGTEATQ